ncbi:ArnT family glycosyltransferase [Kolteria novifilia]
MDNRTSCPLGWLPWLCLSVGLLVTLGIDGTRGLGEVLGEHPVLALTHFRGPQYLAWLLLLPIALLVRSKPRTFGSGANSTLGAVGCFFLCAAVGFGVSAWFGASDVDLPPLYHDEYSYLFQAETFLTGRIAWPPLEDGELFRQMHVLESPVRASRYFPGTGLWLAPFVAIGLPYLAAWCVAGLTAGFAALAGRCWTTGTGYLAGLLVALAPGTVVFGNSLLSTGPTTMWMTAFLWAFLRTYETRMWRWPVLASLFIGLAFLTRPMTAVGLGFPFALYAIVRVVRDRQREGVRFGLLVGTFAVSVLLMLSFNVATTGELSTTPYGLYTARHSPSHVYGFYNRERGQAHRGEETITSYDAWAENLTPARAVELDLERWAGLVVWSGGWMPFVTFGLVALLGLRRFDDRLLLVLLALVGLTAAYTPFAFAGILGWSYFAEALPFLLVALAVATIPIVAGSFERGRPLIGLWWLGLWAIALTGNLTSLLPQAFSPSSELLYPRYQAQQQAETERQLATRGPIVVVVQARPEDSLHTTYVHNLPRLDGPIVRMWMTDEAQVDRVTRERFPERAIYLYRPPTDDRPPQWQLRRAPLK